jgi:hypothetical protein
MRVNDWQQIVVAAALAVCSSFCLAEVKPAAQGTPTNLKAKQTDKPAIVFLVARRSNAGVAVSAPRNFMNSFGDTRATRCCWARLLKR